MYVYIMAAVWTTGLKLDMSSYLAFNRDPQ